jgi:Spy/CpxP family protein refolding chaperone
VFRHHLGALALVAAFAFPLAASAQTAPAPGMAPAAPAAPAAEGQHRHHRHNPYLRAMRGLDLSAAQKQQIATILKNARAARAANANKPLDAQTRRANAQALHQQIEGVLTDAQRTQLHAKLAAGRQNMKTNSPGGQTPPQ